MNRRVAPLAALLLAFAGCLGDDAPERDAGDQDRAEERLPENVTFALTSTAFAEGQPIPRKYSCDANMQSQPSPPLNVTGAPPGTVTLALIAEDRDVPFPETPMRVVTHWLVWNLVPGNGTVTFPEDAVPEGAREGDQGWRGPCPPVGSNPHRYNFTAYALDHAPDLAAGSNRAALEQAMDGHVLATTRLIGTYARQPLG